MLHSSSQADSPSLPESKRLKVSDAKLEESGDILAHSRNTVSASPREHQSSSQDVGGDKRMMDDSSAQSLDRHNIAAGAAPSINWNAGTKANIRISFGRGSVRTGKRENHGIKGVGETPSGLQSKVQQVEDTLTKSLPDHPFLNHDERKKVLQPCVDDTALRVPTNIQENLRLTVIDSEHEKDVKVPSIKNPSLDDDMIARIDNGTNGSSKDEESNPSLEGDNGARLSPEKSGEESGEISETEIQSSSVGGISQIPTSIKIVKAKSTGSESTDGDAMMVYSDSNQVTNVIKHGDPPLARADSQKRKPTILSDLQHDELKLQLRYFYTTKSPDKVDPSNPVRCLVCAHEGHMAEVCSTLTCAVCGEYDSHFTKDCTQVKRCWKCRERGHQASDCPRKVRPVDRRGVVCDLCQRIGHIEDDCELLWRTSGRPWEVGFKE